MINPQIFLMIVPFLVAVVFHEVSHGYVAYKLGDNTAKFAGRLTLNPIAHIDIFGTLILPALLLLAHSPVMFGWAKPVPVNFFNLRNPKRDSAFVAAAGPITNLILAVIFAVLYHISFLIPVEAIAQPLVLSCAYGVEINLIFAFFNLIPILPLDGGRILAAFLPPQMAYKFSRIEPYGIYIVIGLLFFGIFNVIYAWFVIPLASMLL
ncbi:site-2 protease family protein [Hippea jasoniae]|uniref:site-2 protease family protein n=1 Tax=Hippea jasoniae TaxID=944479 RepID=UPI00054CEC15|nr:site-2 protease family protein [Hippea jasoniae]